MDPDFLAYVRGMVGLAVAAGVILALLDGELLVRLFDVELAGGDETDPVGVHFLFHIGSAGLVDDVDDLNALDARHIRVPGAHFDHANAG